MKKIIKISDSFIYNIENNYCFKLSKIKIFKKCKSNSSNSSNIIISNDKGSYSPVQITNSSNFNNLNNNYNGLE